MREAKGNILQVPTPRDEQNRASKIGSNSSATSSGPVLPPLIPLLDTDLGRQFSGVRPLRNTYALPLVAIME
ncbi:hypothetical protein THAOC_16301 [Thalassiosira oceanica]|uniref:Uncharacterized protein n=1 Tax=Thalassiosira oceanica TaxID=159749 RepID=K0SXT0_THAOC|nr:hypothetical protein THAOC_16301 [Thalassiosira oceanica]|eukprot:EJK63062.1 hypothetical protein THAOC_16301 [Thalassiosira oceanica]